MFFISDGNYIIFTTAYATQHFIIFPRKLLTATITKTDFAYSDCTLEGPLPRGDYWIVIQFRYLNEPNLIRCRRRIKVV